MANSYPNPCDSYGKDCYHGCEAWKTRFLYRQKQINAYARRPVFQAAVLDPTKFRYEHPDIIRRYLREWPCAGCMAADVCDTPCPVYWGWWDARMEWLRGRLGV